ncbi:MAG: DUF2922 domain-containing protein [Enterococcus sp.]|nr:DUF2922 domain-containing protein [Enterococcus sp.]
MAKVLKLKFKGSLGNAHTMQVTHPKDGLTKEVVEEAMNAISNAHLFVGKNDEESFTMPQGAAYVSTTTEPIYAVDADK